MRELQRLGERKLWSDIPCGEDGEYVIIAVLCGILYCTYQQAGSRIRAPIDPRKSLYFPLQEDIVKNTASKKKKKKNKPYRYQTVCPCFASFPSRSVTMDSFTVRISKGKDMVEIKGSPNMTVANLRHQAESGLGMVDGGLRLLFKGKFLDDGTTLTSAKVTHGAKMMAMASAKQREADLQAKKNARSAQDNAALDAMREQSFGKDSASASNTSSSAPAVRGDEAIAGRSHVVLKKGREVFRVNIELSRTAGELKIQAAGLQGMNAESRDMKLLHRGRFLKDETLLMEAGVREGSAIMLMFGARHHDRKDAVEDMEHLEREVEELEGKVKGFVSKARGRLLDSTDLALAKGQVLEIYERLKDNLISIRTEERHKKDLEDRLRQVQLELERF